MQFLLTDRRLAVLAGCGMFGGLAMAQHQETNVQEFGIEGGFTQNGQVIQTFQSNNVYNVSSVLKPGFQEVFHTFASNESFSGGPLTGSLTEGGQVNTLWDQVPNNVLNGASVGLSNMDLLIGTGISITGEIGAFFSTNSSKDVVTKDKGVGGPLTISVLGQTFIVSNQPLNSTILDQNGLDIKYGTLNEFSNSAGKGGVIDGLTMDFTNFNDNGAILNGHITFAQAGASTSTGAVPEPASTSALIMGGIGFFARCKRAKR